MQLKFEGVFRYNIRILMQRCGYAQNITRAGKVSYVRRLHRAEFPRFHVYIDPKEAGFLLNLHLDQKGMCYESVAAHSGEYEGDTVYQEARRVAWEIMKEKM